MKSLNPQLHQWCLCAFASLGSVAILGAQTPAISASLVGQTLGSTTVTEVVQFTNSGAPTGSVTVTGVTCRVTLGTGIVTLAAPSLPIYAGGFATGGSAPVSFVLNVSPTVKRFTMTESVAAQDATGNNYLFSLSQLVNVNFPTITVSPSTIAFSPQGVGTTGEYYNFVITNTGGVPVSFGSITASGDFGATNSCGTSLAVNASCYVYPTFTPTAGGTRTGTLTINDSAAGFPHLVSLTGTGVAAPSPFTINPASVTFPAQSLNTTQTQSFNLYNPGSVSIAIRSITISGANASDFAVVNSCGTTAVAGYYCTISIAFTPSANGVRTATAVITDNVPGPAQSVPLSGTGQTLASLSVTPATLTFAGQGLNTTSPAQTVTLTNNGTVPINVTSVAIGGVNAGDFIISRNTYGTTLAVGNYYGCAISLRALQRIAHSPLVWPGRGQ